MISSSLPKTPRELFKLPPVDWIMFNGLIAFFKLSGRWTYPIRACGDVERMSFLDKVYWLYKATNPMRRARRDSGLEEYFKEQESFRCELPQEFRAQSELSISAVGDLINHRYLTNSKERLFSRVSDLIFGADVSMANLECPVVLNAKKEFVFSFKTPPPLYYDLETFLTVKGYQDEKFTFMATACNHSLDFGVEGLESTVKTLKKEGIAYSGVNAAEQDAFRATIIEKRGFRIGLVAYTFGLNASQPPGDRPNIVNRMNLNDGVGANDFRQLKEQINYCKKERVDFLFAHLHWGLEHEFYPTPEQVELAHHLAELGVDSIIGHHPHVVQPMEFYRTKRDPLRLVPIYYSLGNLINYFSAPYLCRSSIAQITLAKGVLQDGSERVYVKRAQLAEVRQEVDEGNKSIRLVPA